MIKKLIYLNMLLGFISAQAQTTTASPFSYFGLGLEKSQNTNEINQMGGLSVFSDSIHLNISNPATYSNLKRATFSMGASAQFTTLSSTDQESTKNITGGIDYIALAIPYNKFSLGLGIKPFSVVGYGFSKKTEEGSLKINNSFEGKGGVNTSFLGLSYKLNDNLSLGAQASYLFGDISKLTRKSIINEETIYSSNNRTEFLTTNKYSGFKYQAGIYYNHKINDSKQVSASVVVSPSYSLNDKSTQNLRTIKPNNTNGLNTIDEVNKENPSQLIKNPMQYDLGIGYGQKNKWFIGIDSRIKKTSVFNDAFTYENASFENATKISLGGYITPRYNSYTSYFKRMTYRAGITYDKTGLLVQNESLIDQKVHLGLGFPVGRYASNLNLGIDLGQRGAKSNIKERYILLSIGFSLNDVWFAKRKFN